MAITKERLEELIEHELAVFEVYADGEVDRIDLSKYNRCGSDTLVWGERDEFKSLLKNLFERKEDAIHASKYVNMEKAEKLSLPFWSEVIKKSGEWSLIFKRYRYEYLLNFVIDDKDKNWITLLINYKNNKKPKFAKLWNSELNKESYAEACEIIKKIWENK